MLLYARIFLVLMSWVNEIIHLFMAGCLELAAFMELEMS